MIFNYRWFLKDANFTKDKGKVFSCFACGGGSTMGYKLAGYDVIGCNEIDPKMMAIYKANHKPKYSYLEPIQTFKLRKDLPEELYSLDILDGSPPCSSFSLIGNREEDWGKDKKFTEGQSKQVLDTLFFDFIDLAKELQPKVIIAENVKGLLAGKAKKYVIKIYEELDKAGYYCQHWILNAKDMGVPQRRERVFFVALRKDLSKKFLIRKDFFTIVPEIDISYSDKEIPFSEVYEKRGVSISKVSSKHEEIWKLRNKNDYGMGETTTRVLGKRKYFSTSYLHKKDVCGTLTAHKDNACYILYDEMRYLSNLEWTLISSFPLDYNFLNNNIGYVMGMSVPPLMVARLATDIYDQWFNKM